ncbi:hypothetical protein ANN_09039 [Periplaneta americana]|uniref:Uncharacterized protein n=1 Tax=Periplaneta americana TaxID=6978 RepID=A0ABQ8TMN3_PERAM|nr:hypothetical protein ANN_09039 [Periplaneta americana]
MSVTLLGFVIGLSRASSVRLTNQQSNTTLTCLTELYDERCQGIKNAMNRISSTYSPFVSLEFSTFRPSSATDAQNSIDVIAKMTASPERSVRYVTPESGISRESVRRILKSACFRPYRLQHLHKIKELGYINHHNIKRHFNSARHAEAYGPENLSGFTRKKAVEELKSRLNSENLPSSSGVSRISLVRASYKICEIIATTSKLFTGGEFVNGCLIAVAKGICPEYTSGRQHSLKCAKGTRCRPVCTVVQHGEMESIPPSSYGVHHGALRFPRVRDSSPTCSGNSSTDEINVTRIFDQITRNARKKLVPECIRNLCSEPTVTFDFEDYAFLCQKTKKTFDNS